MFDPMQQPMNMQQDMLQMQQAQQDLYSQMFMLQEEQRLAQEALNQQLQQFQQFVQHHVWLQRLLRWLGL